MAHIDRLERERMGLPKRKRIKKPIPQRVNAWPAGRKFQSRQRKSHA